MDGGKGNLLSDDLFCIMHLVCYFSEDLILEGEGRGTRETAGKRHLQERSVRQPSFRRAQSSPGDLQGAQNC